jgi:putative tricarboxylic transport membrane protein
MVELILSTLSLTNILLIVLGVIWGMIFGIIPGLTATLAVVVLIPVTYGLGAVSGISMLIGIYIGGVSGGLVSAILIGMPGTPASITTVFDGFPMAKKGLGEKALGIGITSNLVGSLLGWICLVTMAPEIAKFALKFGPFEYAAIIIFGLTAVISLSGKSMLKGLVMAVFGLLAATVGLDPTYAMPRNTFGLEFLISGVSPIPAMIGLFVVSQVFTEAEKLSIKFLIPRPAKLGHFFSIKEIKASIVNFLRSGVIGILIGILPGIGGALANFLAYDQAKKASKDPDSFGQGNIQGIIASETANNASIGGALIPMLSLGIPGDAVTAALLGGLMLHGLQPGPLLIRDNPAVVYGIFSSYIVATLAMFAIMMGGIKIFPTILRIQKAYLLPLVLAAGIVGCYNLQYSLTDVWVAVVFGILGFIFQKHDFPLTPIVISLVLGKMLEENLRLSLLSSGGTLFPLFTRPISLVFMVGSVISVAISFTKYVKGKK